MGSVRAGVSRANPPSRLGEGPGVSPRGVFADMFEPLASSSSRKRGSVSWGHLKLDAPPSTDSRLRGNDGLRCHASDSIVRRKTMPLIRTLGHLDAKVSGICQISAMTGSHQREK